MTAVASRRRALARRSAAYLDHLAVERGLAANTLASYRRDLRRYVAVLAAPGHRPSSARSTEADVAGLPAPRCARATPTTRRWRRRSAARAVVAVRGLHGSPLREGLAGADPAARGPPARAAPAAAQGDRRSTTCERLLDAAGPATAPPLALRDRALLELLYGTGARISEAVGLDVDDLDLADGPRCCCAARAARSGWCRSGRYAARGARGLPGPGPARRCAAGRARARRAVFLNARGGRLSRQSAWTVLRAAAERAGLTRRGLTAHAAALVRHPPARRRRRRPGRPGAARPRLGDHHPGLHAGHRGQAARGLRDRASPRAR